MELNDAARMARELIREHLGDEWVFKWDHARVRMGQCRYQDKVIRMSRHIIPLTDEDQVRDTILHEIAHGLAGPAAKHGPIWKAHARRLGANPKPTYNGVDTTSLAKYVAVCPKCSYKYTMHRLTRRRRYGVNRCRFDKAVVHFEQVR